MYIAQKRDLVWDERAIRCGNVWHHLGFPVGIKKCPWVFLELVLDSGCSGRERSSDYNSEEGEGAGETRTLCSTRGTTRQIEDRARQCAWAVLGFGWFWV